MMTILETITLRTSCRSYGDKPIEPDKLTELKDFLASNKEAPFGSVVRFRLLHLDHQEIGNLKNLGTYGVIRGARQFIIGAVQNHPMAMEDYGYCMEMNILKATSLGLGTCLLGGTFNRSGFAQRVNREENELLPVISPVGYAGDKKTIIDRTFRWMAGSDKRKPWDELFYDGNREKPLKRESAGTYEMPLECVRIAPSASNKQPWRIIKGSGQEAFHFYLKRTRGYENIIKDIKLQNVDMGIALCHFDMSAKELGLKGDWNVNNPHIKSDGMEYIVSWINS
jgi:nitroreductase